MSCGHGERRKIVSVAIVTDSQTCIPRQLAEELGITVLPYILNLDDHQYRDGVDITPEEFYRLLPTLSRSASTSAIPPGTFLEALEALAERSEGILVITIASTMSGTYNNALLAAESFVRKPVVVLDSRTAAMAQGLVVLEVAEAAAGGASLQECLEIACKKAEKAELYAYITTFEFLHKSGRVNAVTALAAEALSIKPVFRFKDGRPVLVARKLSKAKALSFIAGKVSEYYRRQGPPRVSVFHADARGDAEELAGFLRKEVETRGDIIITQFTPVMGCHTGPGLVGAAFL